MIYKKKNRVRRPFKTVKSIQSYRNGHQRFTHLATCLRGWGGGGTYNRNIYFFCLQVDGPITGGEGTYNRDFMVRLHWPHVWFVNPYIQYTKEANPERNRLAMNKRLLDVI